jgi:hypothetical protein
VRPSFEISDVINSHWKEFLYASHFNAWQLRTLDAIRRCRTASLGGHVDLCTACGHMRISYNSCRNRHCPKCQQVQREKWIRAREDELLPVPYFHVVFTVPEALNRICLFEPAKVYNMLFSTAWSVMKSFAADPNHLGADTGMIAILHTWGQNLSLHPHLHCVVPAGGLTKAGFWKQARGDGNFLFPVKAMSAVFRARFVAALRQTIKGLDQSLYDELFKTSWVVYAKKAFGGPQQVIEYLGRYTHKIAISNHRILNVTGNEISFSYKDYRQQGIKKVMILSSTEFIRRFSLHILPKGFVRIRHFGILSSSRKCETLPVIHGQLHSRYTPPQDRDTEQVMLTLGFNPLRCPACNEFAMITILAFDRRGPPDSDQLAMLKEKVLRNRRCEIQQA